MEALNCLRQLCDRKKPIFRIPGFLLSSSLGAPGLSLCPRMRYFSSWGGGHLEQREQALPACRGQVAMREQDRLDAASTLVSRGPTKHNATSQAPAEHCPIEESARYSHIFQVCQEKVEVRIFV